MKILLRLAALVLAASTLAACGTPIRREAFNAALHGSPKVIKVLPMRFVEVDLFILGNPGFDLGLIGYVFTEPGRQAKADWLREEARVRRFNPVASFQGALAHALAGRGTALEFSAEVMERSNAKTRRTQWGLRRHYEPVRADAQLDVNFDFVGYTAAGRRDSSPYRPTAVVSARLVSADGRRVLFEDQIVYNGAYTGREDDAITINPDERYRYTRFDDIKAAGTDAMRGLDLALAAAAEELAKQL